MGGGSRFRVLKEPETTSSSALLTVRYDGTDFAGWQRQPNARTVEGEVTRAARELTQGEVEVRGATRTDAGVHAYGQAVAIDAVRALPRTAWTLGMNRLLPHDVSVVDAAPCAHGYAPRFDAIEKTYRYEILASPFRDPLERRTRWHVPALLANGVDDALAHMREAARVLLGRHDFKSFRAADDGREQTTRTLHEISVAHDARAQTVSFTVRGDAFLKNMVRIISGTLVDVAAGRRTTRDIERALGADGRREDVGITAPAHGLFLVHVRLGRSALDARR